MMNKSSHNNGQTGVLIVCKTLEDVHEAKKKYLEKKRLRLSLAHCIFQEKQRKNKSE